MSTVISTQHIKNLRKADKFSVRVHCYNFNNDTLSSNGNGSFTVATHNNKVESQLTTYGVPFNVTYEVLLNDEPLQNVSESIIEVSLLGADCQFLGYLLKPNDELSIDIKIDNFTAVMAVVTVYIYRGDTFLCKVQLPTEFYQKLGDVLTYERR